MYTSTPVYDHMGMPLTSILLLNFTEQVRLIWICRKTKFPIKSYHVEKADRPIIHVFFLHRSKELNKFSVKKKRQK
jgi:hypothetical protein